MWSLAISLASDRWRNDRYERWESVYNRWAFLLRSNLQLNMEHDGKQPSLSFFILADPGPFNWAELGFYTLCRHKSVTVRQKNRGLCRNNSDKNVLTVGGWALDYPTGTRTHPSKENVFPLGGREYGYTTRERRSRENSDFRDFHFLSA